MGNRFFCWGLVVLACLLAPSLAAAQMTVSASIENALKNNPRLQVLQSNRDALRHELRQAKGGYLPKVDLAAGYGTEQHSDAATRVGSNPGDEDWESRGEVSATLNQLLYDGGAVSGRVAVQQAKLESAEHRVFDNAEAIALDAIIAHLEVYRQRKLVALAEDNLKAHQEILRSLQERQRAGAGSIADVTQTQGRLARAQATLASEKAGLGAVLANYERVVGEKPAAVAFAGAPSLTPATFEEALELVRKRNPKVQALSADINEADARKKQARAADYPRFNLELSSDYSDQVQGDGSWQHNNAAMVRMRWNIFNGGSDLAGKSAAQMRVQQALANRNDQLFEVVEEAMSTWAQYQAAREQNTAYGDAVKYSRQTLDSYLKQFNVAQRSLLDVLDAENELFQSAGLWVTAQVNETIGACRLLALAGRLQEAKDSFAASPEPDTSIKPLQLSAQNGALGGMPVLETPPVLQGKSMAALPVTTQEGGAAKGLAARPNPVLEPPQSFLERWAAAWTAKDVETYLACYGDSFTPAGGLSRAAWEQQRRARVQAPRSIQVELTDLQVETLPGDRARVIAAQSYRSDRYSDQTRKQFELAQKGGRWFIVAERVLDAAQ